MWPAYDPDAVAIQGLEDTITWSDMAPDDAVYEVQQIKKDKFAAIEKLKKNDLQFLLD